MNSRTSPATVRNCWDAGLKLSQCPPIADSIKMARTEPEFATAMIEARPSGDEHWLSS